MDKRNGSSMVEDVPRAAQRERAATRAAVPATRSKAPRSSRRRRQNVTRARHNKPAQQAKTARTFATRMLRFFLVIGCAYLAADAWGALEMRQLPTLFALVPLSLATSLVVSGWLTALVFYDNGGGVTAMAHHPPRHRKTGGSIGKRRRVDSERISRGASGNSRRSG
jgi:hypothetical protein